MWLSGLFNLLKIGFNKPSRARVLVMLDIIEELNSSYDKNKSLLFMRFAHLTDDLVESDFDHLYNQYESLFLNDSAVGLNETAYLFNERPISSGSPIKVKRIPADIMNSLFVFYVTTDYLHVPTGGDADTLINELDFMSYLFYKESYEMGNELMSDAQNTRRALRSFLEIHLGLWTNELVSNVYRNIECGFYRTLGALLDETITYSSDYLNALQQKY